MYKQKNSESGGTFQIIAKGLIILVLILSALVLGRELLTPDTPVETVRVVNAVDFEPYTEELPSQTQQVEQPDEFLPPEHWYDEFDWENPPVNKQCTTETLLIALSDSESVNFSCEFADLRDINLSGMDLGGFDFRGADLRGADLSFANLNSAIFDFADLRSANLEGVILTDASLINADMREINLKTADLTNANLEQADARLANLTDAVLTGSNYYTANFTLATLPNGEVFDWLENPLPEVPNN